MVVEGYKIDNALIEEYQRDGAVLVKGVFSQQWIEKVKTGIEKNLKSPSKYGERLVQGDGAYFDDYCNWQLIKEFKDYVYNSPAASIAGQFMKSSEVVFYHEHVLNKEPGTTKKTPWHHDQAYYPIDGDKVCSLWMPIDPIPFETCCQFVAGSHQWPKWFHPRKFATESNYPLKEEHDGIVTDENGRQYFDMPAEEIDSGKWPILQWKCEPGDVIIFHMRSVHGAAGNSSTTTHRRVLSTRWLGDDAVLATRPWEISPPITGGLQPGQRVLCDTFPLVYSNK